MHALPWCASAEVRICKKRVRKLKSKPTPMMQTMAGTPQIKSFTRFVYGSYDL